MGRGLERHKGLANDADGPQVVERDCVLEQVRLLGYWPTIIPIPKKNQLEVYRRLSEEEKKGNVLVRRVGSGKDFTDAQRIELCSFRDCSFKSLIGDVHNFVKVYRYA